MNYHHSTAQVVYRSIHGSSKSDLRIFTHEPVNHVNNDFKDCKLFQIGNLTYDGHTSIHH